MSGTAPVTLRQMFDHCLEEIDYFDRQISTDRILRKRLVTERIALLIDLIIDDESVQQRLIKLREKKAQIDLSAAKAGADEQNPADSSVSAEAGGVPA